MRNNAYHLVSRRDLTPAICYDDCDVAYKIALSTGKNDKLCAQGSSFHNAYAACQACIADNSENPKSVQVDLEPEFKEFLEYCEGKDIAESTIPVTTTRTRTTELSTSTPDRLSTSSAATLESCETCSVLTMTDFRSQIIEYTYDPNRITASLRRDVFASPTASSEASDGNDSSSGPDLATIIGPVVPSVILLIILGVLGFRWLKRRKATKAQQGPVPNEEEPREDKAQLHSDCIPRPTFELEGSVPGMVDGTMRPKDTSEMAANEPAAQEMSTDKSITRKPVGS